MKPEQLFLHLQNPHHYTGKEINRSKNNFSRDNFNVCLVFPDTYEIGMSHQGIKLLYRLLNQIPKVNAERCFLPDLQSIRAFRDYNVPLFSLENRKPLGEFDLIAFSLLSELNFTNILAVLDLAKIPLNSADRDGLPLVGAGGISVINPEPLRQFIDFFAFGDGEHLFPVITRIFLEQKKNDTPKEQVLSAVDTLPGFYVPRFYPLKKEGPFLIPDTQGKIIHKQYIPALSQGTDEMPEIVPVGQVVFDRLDIEVARGCPNQCRFCQARQYYAPFRIQTGETVLNQIKTRLSSTGLDTLSLASLSTGDHPELPSILSGIDSALTHCTAFSFPSLRPRTLTDQMLKKVSQYRRTGLTLVPEAGSERLRRVIGKDVTEEEILSAVDNALRNNWQRLKLYFMLGLPTETDEDILAAADLLNAILNHAADARKKIELTVSFSTFVPKPHTPFQWAPRLSIQEAKRRIYLLKSRVRESKKIKFDFHSFEKGVVETILSRGDSRVGMLLEDAYNCGELFTAWDISFHADIWLGLVDKYQLWFLLDDFSDYSTLPWSFLQINQPQDILKREFLAAQKDDYSRSCSKTKCSDCRRCLSGLDHPVPPTPSTSVSEGSAPPVLNPVPKNPFRYRLFFGKTGDFRFFPHLALQKYIERMIRISGIPFLCTEGFHPRMKMSMLPPLPVFAGSHCECLEIVLTDGLPSTEILDRINQVDTPLKFLSVTRLKPETKSLVKDIKQMSFSYTGPREETMLAHLQAELLEGESMQFDAEKLVWQLSSPHDLSARFGKTYRLIDPERKYTHCLFRHSITFHSDPPKEGES